MNSVMLYAVLICTDQSCAEEFEAWGELEDFDDLLCEACGCTLQALAFCEWHVHDRRRSRLAAHVQLRNAA